MNSTVRRVLTFTRDRQRGLLFILGILVVAGLSAYLFLAGGGMVSTDNAYLKSNRVTISAEVSGRLLRTDVEENQQVAAGEPLFVLDSEPYRIAVARLEADLLDRKNEILALQARYRESEARLHLAIKDLEFAERELKRVDKLAANRLASESRLDQVKQADDQARQNVEVIRQEMSALLAELGGNPVAPLTEHPRYLAAQAALESARLDLSHTVVTAPANGIVTQLDRFRPGEYVQAGAPLFSLVETDRLWVEANLKETELQGVQPGQHVSIEVDAYPGIKMTGKVASIGAATGSEFSVLPPQNATGNWIKVTQRIPVRISISEPEQSPPLRLGMSAKVIIDLASEDSTLAPSIVQSVVGDNND